MLDHDRDELERLVDEREEQLRLVRELREQYESDKRIEREAYAYLGEAERALK